MTGKTEWKQKFNLIDDCNKKGTLIETPKQFLKLCKTCNRKKISPIELCLQQKVSCWLLESLSCVLLFVFVLFFGDELVLGVDCI